ncbi:MAG: putative TetR family transcriptional regulator, partial [Solirubrobacterales bacterium]|nr:putative TetR family transcriptional regulator [Solirubrobacterales bacterium]
RGFQQTTMHDIAATAGVASGTAYQYFSDKADVLRCLLADLEDKLFRETRVPVGRSGRMAARDSVLRYLEVYREHAAIYGAWWQLLQPPTEFTSAWAALHNSFRRAWVKALDRGQADGLIGATVDAEITADLIEATYERCARSRIVMGWDDEVSDEEVAEVMARLLGDGLYAPAPA